MELNTSLPGVPSQAPEQLPGPVPGSAVGLIIRVFESSMSVTAPPLSPLPRSSCCRGLHLLLDAILRAHDATLGPNDTQRLLASRIVTISVLAFLSTYPRQRLHLSPRLPRRIGMQCALRPPRFWSDDVARFCRLLRVLVFVM